MKDVYEFVDSMGFEIFPYKLKDGLYGVLVWHNDVFLRKGAKTYTDWIEAVNDTYTNLYNHYKNKN